MGSDSLLFDEWWQEGKSEGHDRTAIHREGWAALHDPTCTPGEWLVFVCPRFTFKTRYSITRLGQALRLRVGGRICFTARTSFIKSRRFPEPAMPWAR